MKLARESKTVWASATSIVAALVTLILHYSSAVALSPAELGAAWTGVLMGATFLALRFYTSTAIGKGEEPRKKGRRPIDIAYIVLMALALLAPALTVLSGCPPRDLRGTSVMLEVEVGPPCKIAVILDGETVQTVTAKRPCKFEE